MTVIPPAFSAIGGFLQNGLLVRQVHDALFPHLMWRSIAIEDDPWPVNSGELLIMNKRVLAPPDTRPRTPGQVGQPIQSLFEHWQVELAQYGKHIETHMPTGIVQPTPRYWEDLKTLGEQAGQTMDRLPRDELFRRYIGGQTKVVSVPAATQVSVASVNGFEESTNPTNGYPVQTSSAAPKRFYVDNVLETQAVIIDAIPTDQANPFGPGVLVLDQAPALTISVNSSIVATDAPRILRAGTGNTNVDAIAPADTLTLDHIEAGVTQLRENFVPPVKETGLYHVHVSPRGMGDLFLTNKLQRLNEGRWGDNPFLSLAVAQYGSLLFFTNNTSPYTGLTDPSRLVESLRGSSATAGDIGAEIRNFAGTEIHRALLHGDGAMYEKRMDESLFMSEAGVQGKVGGFHATTNQIVIPLAGVRLILHAVGDMFAEHTSSAWSWSGSYGVPTDLRGGRNQPNRTPRFKRGIIIEHAATQNIF